MRDEPHRREDGAVNFYHFVEALSVALEPGASVVADAGSSFYVMGQGFRLKDGQRFISSGSMGAMGFALPAANGAAAADPSVPTVCVTGDGSLMTNVQELATMSQYKLNVKLFILNNDGYVSMRNTQQAFADGHQVGADRDSGVFIPTMTSLAESFELPIVTIADDANLEESVRRVLEMDGPVLCEVIAQRDQDIIPAVISIKLPDGRMRSGQIHEMSPLLGDDVTAREIDFVAELTS